MKYEINILGTGWSVVDPREFYTEHDIVEIKTGGSDSFQFKMRVCDNLDWFKLVEEKSDDKDECIKQNITSNAIHEFCE